MNKSNKAFTLLGNDPLSIIVGSTYIDAGAIATDSIDGDITNKIVTTGTVNINAIGTYTINYSVKNSLGNQSLVTRTVNVIDNVLPVITFGTNGNSTWAKSRSTTVTKTYALSSSQTYRGSAGSKYNNYPDELIQGTYDSAIAISGNSKGFT